MTGGPYAIWKFAMRGPTSKIMMPIGATILSALLEDETVVLYAGVDLDVSRADERHFEAVNTGDRMEDRPGTVWTFITTVKTRSGIVWHVFEVEQEPSVTFDVTQGDG